MTQEEKDLLLNDLCARIPYKVKIQTAYTDAKTLEGIQLPDYFGISDGYYSFDYMECKPYLRPMSSMTEEQKKELAEINPEFYSLICWDGDIHISSMNIRGYDWLNKNHFDYRGLIPKGLANDATKLNIY